MQRARRLASVAVAAGLTIGGLSACRSEPDVAVYLGQAKITVAEVQRVYNDAITKFTAAQAQAQPGQGAAGGPPISAPDIVDAMVSREVGRRLAQPAGISVPNPLPLAEVGQALGLPADTEYVKLYAEGRLLFANLLQKAPAGTATDADIRHVYDVFAETGAMKPGLTYDSFKSSVSPEAIQTLGKAIGLKQQAQTQVDQLGVRVNPRYSAAEIDVYTEAGPDNKPLPLVSVPLTPADSSPVIDAR